MEFLFAVIVLGCALIGITYLLSRLFKKKIFKYVPSFLLLVIFAYLIISARFFETDGLTSLIKGIWSVILFFVSIIGIVTSIVIDIYNKKR